MKGILFFDPPADGKSNMDRDRSCAEFAARQSVAVLRLYCWSEPTLSLGRFQSIEDLSKATNPSFVTELLDVARVQRTTGGGAILHDHDWTYSLSVPNERGKGHEGELYRMVHAGLVQWITRLGWKAQLHQDAQEETPLRQDGTKEGCRIEGNGGPTCDSRSFLCFDRRSDMDIVVGGSKVLGSAQKRFPGAILQHGSLLLARSRFAPHLRGLSDIEESAPENGQESRGKASRQLAEVGIQGMGEAIRSALERMVVSDWELGSITG